MNDIHSSHYCTRCRRRTVHRMLNLLGDSIQVQCLDCLTSLAKQIRQRYRF